MTDPLGVWAWFPGDVLTGTAAASAWDLHGWDEWLEESIYGEGQDSTLNRAELDTRAAKYYGTPVTLIATVDTLVYGDNDHHVIPTYLIYPKE